MRSSQRIVLTGNKAAYAATMAKEFGPAPTIAEQQAKNSIWWWNSSTTVLDIGSLSYQQQRIFVTATTIVKRFESQMAPKQTLSSMSWLANGSAYVVSAHIVELAGISTLDKYKSSWLNSISKISSLPDLTELQSQQDWTNSSNKYGSNTVNCISELATAYLVERYGFETINSWFQATKDTNDSEKAFVKIYGIPASQFTTEFKEFLTTKLAKMS